MEYNTQREKLILPEYGRNIQKLVNVLKTIEDREKRNEMAKYIVHLMGNITNKTHTNQRHKLWFHLAMMANFELDIDYPYPLPSPEELSKKPPKLPYKKNKIMFPYYGKNIENLLNTIAEMEDENYKRFLTEITANHMKKLYATWNKAQVNDNIILEDIKKITGGKLNYTLNEIKLLPLRDLIKNNNNNNNKRRQQQNNNNNNNNNRNNNNGRR